RWQCAGPVMEIELLDKGASIGERLVGGDAESIVMPPSKSLSSRLAGGWSATFILLPDRVSPNSTLGGTHVATGLQPVRQLRPVDDSRRDPSGDITRPDSHRRSQDPSRGPDLAPCRDHHRHLLVYDADRAGCLRCRPGWRSVPAF